MQKIVNMAKKQTNKQKFNDLANAVNQINAGEKVKRIGAKDGSVPTHPVVPCLSLLEHQVLIDCLYWLHSHCVLCNRNNVGAGEMGTSGYYSYGIKDAGDIVGLLLNGRHFEIETKAGTGGRLTIGQQKRMQKIRENNGLYFVVHGVPELEHYMGKYV